MESRGSAYVKFATRNDASDALEHMSDARIGGVIAEVCFMKHLLDDSVI